MRAVVEQGSFEGFFLFFSSEDRRQGFIVDREGKAETGRDK